MAPRFKKEHRQTSNLALSPEIQNSTLPTVREVKPTNPTRQLWFGEMNWISMAPQNKPSKILNAHPKGLRFVRTRQAPPRSRRSLTTTSSFTARQKGAARCSVARRPWGSTSERTPEKNPTIGKSNHIAYDCLQRPLLQSLHPVFLSAETQENSWQDAALRMWLPRLRQGFLTDKQPHPPQANTLGRETIRMQAMLEKVCLRVKSEATHEGALRQSNQ